MLRDSTDFNFICNFLVFMHKKTVNRDQKYHVRPHHPSCLIAEFHHVQFNRLTMKRLQMDRALFSDWILDEKSYYSIQSIISLWIEILVKWHYVTRQIGLNRCIACFCNIMCTVFIVVLNRFICADSNISV